MNYNLPPDEGKKKKDLYWNVCIVLGIIAIIAFIVDANQGMNEARGEYVTNSAGDNMYERADGELLLDQRHPCCSGRPRKGPQIRQGRR